MSKEAFRDKKIGVLMGGMSAEREISLKSGRAIMASLTQQGFSTCPIDVNEDVALILRSQKIDAAFIALHGRYGEDGLLQGLLEMMKIPYTGSGLLASALGMNKALSRQIFLSYGIPTPPYRVATRSEAATFQKDPRSLFDYPMVVKPLAQGSSVGVSIVEKPSDMEEALRLAFCFGPKALVEPYIAGMEVHVGILDQTPLGGIEIRSKRRFYDYTAKYVKGMSEHLFPAPLPPATYQEVLSLGLTAHLALGCSDYSRVDMIVGRDGKPCVLEVNTLPGMTETSLLPEMARGVGISFDQLVERILGMASLDK